MQITVYGSWPATVVSTSTMYTCAISVPFAPVKFSQNTCPKTKPYLTYHYIWSHWDILYSVWRISFSIQTVASTSALYFSMHNWALARYLISGWRLEGGILVYSLMKTSSVVEVRDPPSSAKVSISHAKLRCLLVLVLSQYQEIVLPW